MDTGFQEGRGAHEILSTTQPQLVAPHLNKWSAKDLDFNTIIQVIKIIGEIGANWSGAPE